MPQGPPEKEGEIKLVLDREALTYIVLNLSLGWAAESRIHRCKVVQQSKIQVPGRRSVKTARRGQKQCKSQRSCTPQMFSSYSNE